MESKEEMIPIHTDPEIVHRQQRIMRNTLATLHPTLVNEIKIIGKLSETHLPVSMIHGSISVFRVLYVTGIRIFPI